MKSLSRVWLFATPWTVAHQAPPSMGFSRQEYWSGLPFPSPEDHPNPGIEPRSPSLQADAGRHFNLWATREAYKAARDAPNSAFWMLRTGILRVEKSKKGHWRTNVCVCVCVCVGDGYMKDNYFRILPLAKTFHAQLNLVPCVIHVLFCL